MLSEEEEKNIEEKDFIGLEEAARFLGVHKNTLHHWVKKDWENKTNNNTTPNKFLCPPYTRIGSRYRFRREDIEKFMQDPMKNH